MCDRPRRSASLACWLTLVLVGCHAEPTADQALAVVLVRRLAAGPHDTVADIGAGKGTLTHALSQALPSGRVIATELRAGDVAQLRSDASARGERNVQVRQAEPESSSLADGEVDLIVLCRVDHLLRDRRAYLAGLRRALRPNGRVAIANDLREAAAVDAVAAMLGWREVDRFEPGPQMFARVFEVPAGG